MKFEQFCILCQTTISQVKNGYAKIDEWEKCLDDGTFCDTIRSEIVGNLSSNSMFQLSYMTLDSVHNPYPKLGGKYYYSVFIF